MSSLNIMKLSFLQLQEYQKGTLLDPGHGGGVNSG